MKITTYNPDGSVNNERDVNVYVPDYITNFDNEHSFLNITAQEIEILESDEDFVRKSIVKRLLIQSVCYDYSNFVAKYKIDVCTQEIMAIYEQSLSNPDIVEGDRIFSSILRIYSKTFRYGEIYEDGMSELINKMFHYEEFLNVIVEQGRTVDGDMYGYSAWIHILFFHAARSSMRWDIRHDNYDNAEGGSFFVSLQNLINKYYYTLARVERIGQRLPDGLKFHMDALEAFVKKPESAKSTAYYSSSHFIENIIRAIYKTKEQNRGDIYSLVHFISGSHPSKETGMSKVLNFDREDIPKSTMKYYKIELYNHHNVVERKYIISDSELFTMRETNGVNELYTELLSFFEKMYETYVNVFKSKWETNVMTDAEIYFDKHPQRRDNWTGFYNYEVGRIREESRTCHNHFEPQQCFFHLLCDYIHPSEELTFDRDVLASLILMLDEIECNSQEGLYECRFKINYIKKKLPQRSPIDVAVANAMEYIECLFLPQCKYVPVLYENHIQPLMRQLICNVKVREKIAEVKPRGFVYGFNLKLVYNLLGLLHKSCIISGGVKKIDLDIYNYNHKKGIESFKTNERKSYISNWDKEGSEIFDFKNELISIVRQQIKDS